MKHTLWLVLAAALVTSLLVGCDSESSGFLSCGQRVCGPRQECAISQQGTQCVCLPGYLGDECDVCAPGYRSTSDGQCELIPIDCDEDPSVCGDNGQCTRHQQGDFCRCEARFEGRLCDRCTDGFQDNDLDGTCEPTCAESDIDCDSPRRCSDAGGIAECVCPAGTTGEECELCALGYRHNGSTCVLTCEAADLGCGPRQVCDDSGLVPECVCQQGYAGSSCTSCAVGYQRDPLTQACFPTCALAGLECGDHGQCSELIGFAYCQCDLGYAGEKCDRCAEGYMSAADDTCRFVPSAAYTLLADAAVFGSGELVAIDPTTGDAIAVGEQRFGGLAPGQEAGAVFSSDGTDVIELDLESGQQSVFATIANTQPALALDTSRDQLYAIMDTAAYGLLSLALDKSGVTTQGSTGLARVLDMTYDAANDRVLVLGEGLSALDPTTLEVTMLPDPPPATRGIAFDASGTLYALAATDLDATDARIDACRRSAAGLGIVGYAAAMGSVIEPNPGDTTLALDSSEVSGPEVVAYLGRGVNGGQRTVTITTDNDEAVLCLDVREQTALVIPAAASFRALVLYTVQSQITVDVEQGFSASDAPAIHLGATVPAFSVSNSLWVKEYDVQEWQALALPIDARFYAPGPGVLHELDASFASVSTVTLPSFVRPLGTMTAWTPPPTPP